MTPIIPYTKFKQPKLPAMKPKIKYLACIFISAISISISAQDVFFTISAEYNNTKVSVDSISFENISNNTKISFTALPEREEYEINLTTQEVVEPIGMPLLRHESAYRIVRCIPGELVISCNNEKASQTMVDIVDIEGRILYSSRLINVSGNGFVQIDRGSGGIFFVRFRSPHQTKVFKAIGSVTDNRFEFKIDLQSWPLEARRKSMLTENSDDFSVQLGDTMKIKAYKDELFSTPSYISAEENNPILINFTDTEPASFFKINDNQYDLVDGIWMNYGNNRGTFSYHSLYLLSDGHNIDWETLDVSGSGAVINLEIFRTDTVVDPETTFLFVQPDTFSTETICDGTDVNNDGIINEDDCYEIPVIPEGNYIDSKSSVYDSNADLNDMIGLNFKSGNVSITKEDGIYTIELYCIGENGDVIQGYYRDSLHYFDFSEEKPVTAFPYEEAIDTGYDLLTKLVDQSWLIDGVFCGEYNSPSSIWDNIANRTISSTDGQISQLWDKAYDLIFNANNLLDSIEYTDLTALEMSNIMAEARAMRAFGYYTLVSKFGAVPIYPGTTYSQIPRSSVTSVTDSIIADLMFSSSYLPVLNYFGEEKIKFSKGAVTALLSKVYFLSENWENAYNKVQEIMNSGNYEIEVNANNKYTTLNSLENIQAYDSIHNITFRSAYDKGSVIPISHYTEQLLIAMECEVRMGNLNLAGDLYYMLTGTENNSPSLDDVYDAWMDLMFKEGVTLSTISRHGKEGEILNIMDLRTMFPIPYTIIVNNPYMTQNPGY